ncbi:MAG: hypothetical protein MUP55_02450 [Candidatus Aenigmarchaeota archaeon]|nr:hypothetical protein [Candidatus Aenigmarchaeota archaeon]
MIDPKNPPEKVKAWIRRFKKCLSECPKGIWFFSNGELHIMAYGKDGPVYKKEGVDPDYKIDYYSKRLFEGGDW